MESSNVCPAPIWLMAAATVDGTDPSAMKRALRRFEYLGKAADLHVEARRRSPSTAGFGTDTLTILAKVRQARQARAAGTSILAPTPHTAKE